MYEFNLWKKLAKKILLKNSKFIQAAPAKLYDLKVISNDPLIVWQLTTKSNKRIKFRLL